MQESEVRALSGVRVIDAATLAGGPLVGTALGELGADVIKVEQPGAGDPLRRFGDQKDGVGLVWKSLSRNKRCITLDLRQEDGRAVLHRLLDTADVLILNNRPSALARWDLRPDDVSSAHPNLIVVHVSGYGAGGPKSDRPGFGTLAEAMSGFAHLTGAPDGPPTLPTFMLADGIASLNATYATLAALYHRDVNGGAGQVIDVNLIEPLGRLIESATLTYDQLGTIPGRTGNRWDISAPRNTYRTKDGHYIAMSSAVPAIAQRAFVAVGRPDLAENPEYVNPLTRIDHAEEIDAMVAAWIADRTLQEAMDHFERHEVAAAPVYDARQLLEDEHLIERGTFVEVADPDLGRIRVQAPVPRLSATPGVIDHLGTALGSHTDEVLTELLAMSPTEIRELREKGVI